MSDFMDLESMVKRLEKEKLKLKAENQRLRKENKCFKEELQKLRLELYGLKASNKRKKRSGETWVSNPRPRNVGRQRATGAHLVF
jgi:predicted RNase H-like nuclease (RuvC/YqgF family)